MKKYCLRFFSFFLSVLILASVFTALPVTVSAAEYGAVDEELLDQQGYYFNEQTRELTIKFISGLMEYKNDPGRFGEISNMIVRESARYYRPEIGYYLPGDAFQYLNNVKKFTLEGSLDSIIYGCFDGCSSAEEIILPSGVTSIESYAFRNCSALRSIEIPATVTRLGEFAFSGCSSLESVTIPASVTEIQGEAFSLCSSLKTLTFEDVDDAVIPAGKQLDIQSEAFMNCGQLTELNLPRRLAGLGNCAFEGCESLKGVAFPETSLEDKGRLGLGEYIFRTCGIDIRISVPEAQTEYFRETLPESAPFINAAPDFVMYPVEVNGEIFSSEKLEIACGDGWARFEPSTATLTLHNAQLTKSNSDMPYFGFSALNPYDSSASLRFRTVDTKLGRLNLVLEGANSLSNSACGVIAEHDLTVTGGGSLFSEIEDSDSPYLFSCGDMTLDNIVLTDVFLLYGGTGSCVVKNCEIYASSIETYRCREVLFENSFIKLSNNLSLNYHSYYYDDNVEQCDFTIRGCEVKIHTGTSDYSSYQALYLNDDGPFTLTIDSSDFVIENKFALKDEQLAENIVLSGGTEILDGGWNDSSGIHIGCADPPEKTYNIKIDGIICGDAEPEVTLTSSDKVWTAELQPDGSYLAEASNADDVTLAVSANEYVTRTFTRPKNGFLDWKLGTVKLFECPESGILTTHLTVTNGRVLDSFDLLDPVLRSDNGTLIEGTDYTFSYPCIILSESCRKSLRAIDSLSLVLRPDSEATHMNRAWFDISLTEREVTGVISAWSRVRVKVNSDFDGLNNVCILQMGKIVESGTVRSGETYVSQELDDSNGYSLVVYNENPVIGAGASENNLTDLGFEYGEDFIHQYIHLNSGEDTELEVNVPVLSLNKGSELIDEVHSSVMINTGEIKKGNTFLVRAEYALADENTDGSEIMLTIPNATNLVNVSMDNRLLVEGEDYTDNYDSVTVRVNKSSGVIYFTFKPLYEGKCVVAAAAKRGDEIKPFGSASVNVKPELTITAPEKVDSNIFSVRVNGNASGYVYFYINGEPADAYARANSAGTAFADLAVPKNITAGSEMIITAKSGGSEAETTVTFVQAKSKVENLYVDAVGKNRTGTYCLIKDGKTVPNAYYSVPPYDDDDRWTFTAEIIGKKDTLQTDDVDLLLIMSDDDVEWVSMKLSQMHTGAGGIVNYTFKGIYVQPGYMSGQPVPVQAVLCYNDIPQEEFRFDPEREIDWESALGTKKANEQMLRLTEKMSAELDELSARDEGMMILSEIKRMPFYDLLTSSRKKEYDDFFENNEYEEAEINLDWIYSKKFMISDKSGFESLSGAEQKIIINYEDAVKKMLDSLSALALLKKPVYEYGSADEALRELGVTVYHNYTAAPSSGYTQLDKNLYQKYDEKKHTESLIDTSHKLRMDTDYNVFEKRYGEVESAINKLFNGKGKAGEPVGNDGDDDVTITLMAEQAQEFFKAITSSDNPFGDVMDRFRDFVGGSICGQAESVVAQSIAQLNSEGAKTLVPVVENAIKSGDKGKIIEAGMKVSDVSARLEGMEVARIGAKHLGTAINIKGIVQDGMGMYDNKVKSNSYRERKDRISQIAADAMESGYLTYDEGLEVDSCANNAKHALDSLLFGNDVENRHKFVSILATATWNPFTYLGFQGANEIYFGPMVIKAKANRESLESTADINERRLMEIIERARKRKAKGGKKPYLYPEWKDNLRLYASWQRGDVVSMRKIVDPSGVVYEAFEDNVLDGVTATIWYSPYEDGRNAEIWNAGDYDQINPQITETTGYSWDVPEGWWQVRFEKEGYEPAQTDWLPVPPPQLNLKTAMVSTEKPQIETAAAYPDYIELTFTQFMDAEKAVDAEGYDAQWVDAKENPDGKQLSKTLRLTLKDGSPAVGGKLSVELSGAQNYAGTAMEAYSAVLTVTNRPAKLEISDPDPETYVGSSVSFTAAILGADGKPLEGFELELAPGDPDFADIDVKSKQGVYGFTAEGKDIGTARLELRVKGTALSETITLTVFGDREDIPSDVLIGDVDGNGEININDATMIQKYLAELVTFTPEQQLAADTNGDGAVTIDDVTMVQKYIAELVDHLGK